MLIAAACSSGGSGRPSGDGGERDVGSPDDASDDSSDAADGSTGAVDATGTGSSSGGPPADLDAPQFGPDGCALLNTPCTQGSQCCSGLCPVPQLVCTPPTSQP